MYSFGIGKLIICINIVIGLLLYAININQKQFISNNLQHRDNYQNIQSGNVRFPIEVPGTNGKIIITNMNVNKYNNHVYYNYELLYDQKTSNSILDDIQFNRNRYIEQMCSDKTFRDVLLSYPAVVMRYSVRNSSRTATVTIYNYNCK